MKYVIQIKVPWLQLFIRTWNMKLSLNVRKLAQKWKLPPITSLSCTIRMRSKVHRLISQQILSYLWKLSQNPWFRQVSKLYVQFSVPRLFKLGLYFQDKHKIFCFVSVADVGGFLGMILGFSLLDLELVIRSLLSKCQDKNWL